MPINQLREKLRTVNAYNPFHDDFDEKQVNEEINQRLQNKDNLDQEDKHMILTSEAAISLHLAFKELYRYLRESFDKINLNYEEIIEFSIANRNRTYWLVDKERLQQSLKKEEHYLEDAFRFKIMSVDESIGKIDSSAALETEVDALNVILNYLRYFKDKIPTPNPEYGKLQSIEQIKAQSFASTFYYILKCAYEDAVWRDGVVYFDTDGKELKIEFQKPELLLLIKIGIYRLERNASGFFLETKSVIESLNIEKSSITNRHRRENIKIGKLKISQGFIKYQLDKGNDELEFITELYNESSLVTYYDYLENVVLPKVPGFSIRKILDLFMLLIHLFRKASRTEIEDKGVFKKSDLYRFPFRIKIDDIRAYLLRRSTVSTEEVEIFLKFVESKNRFNFWNKQLYHIDDHYVFLLLPLVNPNILYLIDCWLDDGGFSLDERGIFFEKKIKNQLRDILAQKRYQFIIPEKSKFINTKREFEEIDLILVLKTIVVVAEVKCIRYPFEPREIANSLLRLEKGASQIKRKSQFISTNAEAFVHDLGDITEKEIIPLVITNYPLFTGHAIDGIGIVDFYLLKAYCTSGKLTFGKMAMQNGKEISSEIYKEVIFYKDEDEFCQSFKDKMHNPPAVTSMLDSVEIKYNKITPDEFNYQVFVQAGEFKE